MSTALLLHPPLADPPEPYDGMPVSEEDYWEFYYEGHEVTYEWNNGVLEEKGVSDYQTFQVFDWFIQLLIEFLRVHPIADRVGLEMGFRLALPGKVAIRRPDYGVVLHDNPVLLTGPARSYRGIFDLCIEGISTSSRAMQERDTVTKKGEYASGGVPEYYLLHHSLRLRQFYRLGAHGVYEPMPVASDGVMRSAVLPGFQWRLDDLERLPSMEQMMNDPVYRDFVWLPVQQQTSRAEQERERAEQERERAEQERERAEQERERAEQQQARAERLAHRLRALGVDPDAEP